MWHPFSDFDRTVSAMNDLWSRLERVDRAERAGRLAPQRDFEAATALFETPEGYEFRIDVPGATSQDLTLDLNDQTLTLTARREVKPREGWATHRAERQSFEWKRSFTFPAKLDPERTAARFEHGVLTVRLAKAPEVQPRKVAITVA